MYGIEKMKCNAKLAQALRGVAYKYKKWQHLDLQNEIDSHKNALLERYELAAPSYRNKFCTARRAQGETNA